MVQKCLECNKTAYETEAHAVTGVGTLLRAAFVTGRPYLGECGWWHVTSDINGENR
jgi:hypothetical protein